jgi:hypothetical protein
MNENCSAIWLNGIREIALSAGHSADLCIYNFNLSISQFLTISSDCPLLFTLHVLG